MADPTDPTEPGLSPARWRQLYVATIIYGVLTILALWWITARYNR